MKNWPHISTMPVGFILASLRGGHTGEIKPAAVTCSQKKYFSELTA